MTQQTILLIDDDDDFLRILGDRCEAIGLVVERSHNLLSATQIIAKRPPDLICVDVEMPTGNGLEFCEEMARDPATSRIPIIVITGKTDPATRSACQRLHARYLKKSADFWPALEAMLRQANMAKPATEAPRPASGGAAKPKEVVVADDDCDMLELLSQKFSSLGCSVFGVNNALDAINLIHRSTPDLVCLDISMPGGNGLSVCEMMASDERLCKIPRIVLTGRSDDETIRRCHDMLVYYVQKSSDTWDRIAPLARELLGLDELSAAGDDEGRNSMATTNAPPPVQETPRTHELIDAVFAALAGGSQEAGDRDDPNEEFFESSGHAEVPWVLCIDDDADFSDALKIRLEQHGVAVVRAFNGMEGYRLAFTSPARAILLDYHMPNGEGDYILGRLKDNPVTKDIPVIVISGSRDRVLHRRMAALGAADLFVKPIDFEQLRDRLSSYIDILRPVGHHR